MPAAAAATTTRRNRMTSVRQGRVSKQQPHSSVNIASFARVSKPKTIGKEALKDTSITVTNPVAEVAAQQTSKKRKATTDLESDQTLSPSSAAAPAGFVRTTKKSCRRGEVAPPTQQRLARLPRPARDQSVTSDSESCASQAGELLERLRLHSTPATPSSSFACATDYSSDSEDEQPLPQELVDLAALHASLLKTLSLHYAHNGTNVPVDLRTVAPNVSRAWGKRKVTVEDICRCVGILDSPDKKTGGMSSPFSLSDYGRGKVCIEMHGKSGYGPINEDKLHGHFQENLRSLWSARRDNSTNVRQFILALPKAPVTVCESIKKASTVLSKGQRTLEEFRLGVAQKRQEKEAKTQAAAAAPMATATTNADGSKMGLLDRIRLKQLSRAGADKLPSPAELERRAALQRVEDIAAVISMLSTSTAMGQVRISFTMVKLMEKLKDSLRVPISKEEGVSCVRLLANEIAPQWLRVVTIGGKENVVVQTNFQPSKAMIQERVRVVSA